jgi:hypothetical protein
LGLSLSDIRNLFEFSVPEVGQFLHVPPFLEVMGGSFVSSHIFSGHRVSVGEIDAVLAVVGFEHSHDAGHFDSLVVI